MSNRVPWYAMGEDVHEAMTMEKAMEEGKLDFDVEKVQSYIPTRERTDEEGNLINGSLPLYLDTDIMKVEGAFATRRVDNGKPLGSVGARYKVVQNTEAFELFNPLVRSGELRLKMAGCLGMNGEKIWVLAEVGDPVLLVPGDELKQYIVLLNSHDGSTAVKILNTPTSETRGVIHIGDERALSIRHTASVGERLVRARKIIQRSLSFYENFTEVLGCIQIQIQKLFLTLRKKFKR